MFYILLVIVLYTGHKFFKQLVLEGIETDAERRIQDARKRMFQGKFFRLNRKFKR